MKTTPTFRERLRLLLLRPRDFFLQLLCWRYETFLWGFSRMSPGFLEQSGCLRARRAFFRAAKLVPAYARHLGQANATPVAIPETDKANYIKVHSTEARCCAGSLPLKKTMIDESSGSTGTPYNWVRSKQERLESQRFISYFANY